jgi:hypothetical protein
MESERYLSSKRISGSASRSAGFLHYSVEAHSPEKRGTQQHVVAIAGEEVEVLWRASHYRCIAAHAALKSLYPPAMKVIGTTSDEYVRFRSFLR